MSVDGDVARDETAGLRALLDWYRHVGVETFIDDAPHDRFAEFTQAARATGAAPASGSREMSFVPLATTVTTARPAAPGLLTADAASIALSAREAASAADTLEALREALAAFEGCPLKTTATNLVFADGNPEAQVMFVGEAPGADEDASGVPFVGKAGQLLDQMLHAIGLDRTTVYIANVLPWRPPGNRTPTPQEVAACLPFTERQIELVAPRWLITLGAAATQTLTGAGEGIMRLRGRWREVDVGRHRVAALPMLHPAFLLRTPAQKRLAWTDLRKLRRVMDGSGTA